MTTLLIAMGIAYSLFAYLVSFGVYLIRRSVLSEQSLEFIEILALFFAPVSLPISLGMAVGVVFYDDMSHEDN